MQSRVNSRYLSRWLFLHIPKTHRQRLEITVMTIQIIGGKYHLYAGNKLIAVRFTKKQILRTVELLK